MKQLQILTFGQSILLVALFATAVLGYFLVPLDQSLPIHWNIFGEADSYANAAFVLAGPLVLSLVIGLILLGASHYAKAKGEWNGSKSIIMATYSAILTVALVISVCYVLMGLGQQLDMVRILALSLLGLLTLVGNYLPKSRPNNVAGLRIPSTLADENNWRKTHYWAGRTMFTLAIVSFVIVAIGQPMWTALALVVVTAIVPTLLGTYISLRLAKANR